MKKRLLLLYLRTYLNFLAWVAPHKAGRVGFYIFCRPQHRAVKPHHEEFFNTSEKFTIEYDNKKVQAYQWGVGEKKLLLLHGWESHTYWWRHVINTLPKEKYTIISIDAPGHGLSEGNYMNIVHYSGLIEQIILQHGKFYALLAHSLGAFSTAYIFFRLPQLPVEKLVLMAAPGESIDYVNYYQKLVGFSNRAMKEIRKYFVEKVHHEPEYFSLKEFTKKITLPGLMIHDTDDKEAPYNHALAAHKNWNNSKLITTHGLGHNLKSLDLIKDVESFLNT